MNVNSVPEKYYQVGIVLGDSIGSENCQSAIIIWDQAKQNLLARHEHWETAKTGCLVIEGTELSVTLLMSGPLGGDQQLGAMIAEKKLDILIFFTDPHAVLAHDVDFEALLRLCTLNQNDIACNRSTADFVLRSDKMNYCYEVIDSDRAGTSSPYTKKECT